MNPVMIMRLPRPCIAVAAGSSHTCALSDYGELYLWGSNQEGQLGLDVSEQLAPVVLKLKESVIGVACGYFHTLILTESGRVLSFGESDHGKLGLTQELLPFHRHPQLIEFKEKVVQVAAGWAHSVFLTEQGNIYTCGLGNSGQLGQGPGQLECHTPQLITSPNKLSFITVSAGHSHCIALTDKGKVVTWGCGRHGKLCHGEENFSSQFAPVIVKRLRHLFVAFVSCGGCHTMVLGFKRSEETEGDADVSNSNVSSLTSLARARRRVNDGALPPLKTSGLPPLKPSVLPTVPDNEDNQPDNLTDSQEITQEHTVSGEWCNPDSEFDDPGLDLEQQNNNNQSATVNNNYDKKANLFRGLFTWWNRRKNQASSHVAEIEEEEDDDDKGRDLATSSHKEETKSEGDDDNDSLSDQTLMAEDSDDTVESQEPTTRPTLGTHKNSKACMIL